MSYQSFKDLVLPPYSDSPYVSLIAITHTPSKPMMVRSELTESLPAPGHGAPPQDTTTTLGTSLITDSTAKVYIYLHDSL